MYNHFRPAKRIYIELLPREYGDFWAKLIETYEFGILVDQEGQVRFYPWTSILSLRLDMPSPLADNAVGG